MQRNSSHTQSNPSPLAVCEGGDDESNDDYLVPENQQEPSKKPSVSHGRLQPNRLSNIDLDIQESQQSVVKKENTLDLALNEYKSKGLWWKKKNMV